eukprot:CAMPEP_0171066126 /NCGR_PEP_ID=MMETSP0766_2-20121228/7246_1 /TAXON_ID=439317 /ORGANISM="Gambierdiscus australes, Strain CAWD 149" /LENGTH=193 /DNA_ID=CAMNT_0011522281 /DNA_START=72 /DNA_END=650 /DNA_ORIENTATION=+
MPHESFDDCAEGREAGAPQSHRLRTCLKSQDPAGDAASIHGVGQVFDGPLALQETLNAGVDHTNLGKVPRHARAGLAEAFVRQPQLLPGGERRVDVHRLHGVEEAPCKQAEDGATDSPHQDMGSAAVHHSFRVYGQLLLRWKWWAVLEQTIPLTCVRIVLHAIDVAADDSAEGGPPHASGTRARPPPPEPPPS